VRVLAVSGDANLITALTSMMRDWEMEHVRDAKDAAAAAGDATIALIATGSTEKGLEDAQTLWRSGVTLPCLVIGDVAPPASARVRVLVRPFTLQDLGAAVAEVEQGGAFAPYDEAAATVEEIVPEAPAEASVEAEPAPAEAAATPEAEPATPEAEPAAPEPAAAAPESIVEPAEPEPERPAAKSEPEPRRVLVGHDPGEPAAASTPSRDVPAAVEAPAAAVEAPAPAQPAHAAPAQPAPVAKPAPAPAARAQTPPAAPPAPAPVPEAAPKERRRFLRRGVQEQQKAKEVVEEDPTITRLKQAIASARDLERLLAELPVLGQPRAMAHAFLGEVVEMFAPQVAAVYAPGADGNYGVIAAHGLSSVEAGMKVQPSQPLFMEIMTGCEAVLIAPVDLAQGLVAGIGGARTEALLACPLEVSGICHAIVIVGRQDFSEFDLDLLSELAEEAAPGLAVAQLLERLRSV
jgi:hypothetical protein